ncbi:unnamed protein product [Porites evermanni]|uniref:DNA helicase n=1 Tax=Porites evermanni TaxID=104178 RepID=A0ABN8LVS4_9CNID|nr:unnamed protein product [Porites evermanni]
MWLKMFVTQSIFLGGLQLVAFGDFLQLPPVPNTVDDGKYAFESAVWDLTFPHQVILEENFRAKNDEEFINLLREISRGQCSEQSAEIIQSLSRPLNLSDFGLSYIPKVYPLNEDVDFPNMCVLETLHGRDVSNMTEESKGKIRYCGAWAIAKVRNACREYFKTNIYSANADVQFEAKEVYGKNTLNVTLSRKYDKGTLVHITDEMFEWFLKLEQDRVNLLSSESLASHKENLVEKTLSSILGNNHLLGQWKALFTVNESLMPSTNGHALVLHLFNDVVTYYVKMGVGEFLREFRRDFKLQKTEAHRKKVKKKKKDLVSSKITVESINKDTSVNKGNFSLQANDNA